MIDKNSYKKNIGQIASKNPLNRYSMHSIELDRIMNPIGWGVEDGLN